MFLVSSLYWNPKIQNIYYAFKKKKFDLIFKQRIIYLFKNYFSYFVVV